MQWPLISRRRHEAVKEDRERIRRERNQFGKDARACARQLERFTRELSDLKDEVASHIVAAEHPSSALSDARSMALALREALEARGINLRAEFARLEGSDL